MKKNRNAGRPWLDNRAVDIVVPSASVNSKCGMVSPTLVPTSGWSMTLADCAATSVGNGVEAKVDPGLEVDAESAVGSEGWVDAGSASVAEVPQAKTPKTAAIIGININRDISTLILIRARGSAPLTTIAAEDVDVSPRGH